MTKTCVEEWLWDLGCAKIKHIHNDSGIFAANVFEVDCADKY